VRRDRLGQVDPAAEALSIWAAACAIGRIGHTQPRRIAARSLASRGSPASWAPSSGQVVGYKVRFHDRVRPETSVKLMTDGILLAESSTTGSERIRHADHRRGPRAQPQHRFPAGLPEAAAAQAPGAEADRHLGDHRPAALLPHFDDAPVIEVSGRTYPVEVRHRPPEDEHAGERDDAMQQAISDAVAELAREGPGDVLVFLSGEREIRETAETLRKHHPPSTEVLPLYARQGPAEQARVFQPHGTRRWCWPPTSPRPR
jgi:ATP-dependent helicase HrpA